MSLKKVKPKESALIYNPRINDFTLVAELKFTLNSVSRAFEIDQNPHGEASLVPLRNVSVNSNNSELTIEYSYRGKDNQLSLVSDYESDKIIFETITKIIDPGEIFSETEKDKIEIILIEGVISKIYLYKRDEAKLIESLSIVADQKMLYLIRQNPWAKEKILSADFNENSFMLILDDQSSYSYEFSTNKFILSIFKRLVSAAWPRQ
jgi:hypothetical protein